MMREVKMLEPEAEFENAEKVADAALAEFGAVKQRRDKR